MVSSLAPEEAAAASPCATVSKNADQGNRSAVASPVRHMHPDVAALLLAAGTTPRRRRRKMPAQASAAAELRGRARYDCAFEEGPPAEAEDGDGFAPPRLVWAKVRGHPWWPGQVFDPADASALALGERIKRRRDAVVLVACFGDRTFVWADAEDLLPLRDGFPHLADFGGRSTSKSMFAPAVDAALDEVSRRVDAGLSCGCGAASVKRQVFVNSGLRRGARGADAVDAAFARDAFRGEAFVGYVRALAVAPTAGADRLDLAVSAVQLKAFALWRSAANPDHDAMVVAARATTPRRERTNRRLFRGDAPAGDITLSMCARAAAAADVAFMRYMFPGEEYPSAMAVTPPAGAELCGLAVPTTAQRKAFDQWRGASPRGITECTGTVIVADGNAEMVAATPPAACRDTAMKTRSLGSADADADPGKCRTVTSCISSGEDSACENDSDDAWETESEDSEPASEWVVLGWKDQVIVIQFVAIVLLVCQLMWQHSEKIEL